MVYAACNKGENRKQFKGLFTGLKLRNYSYSVSHWQSTLRLFVKNRCGKASDIQFYFLNISRTQVNKCCTIAPLESFFSWGNPKACVLRSFVWLGLYYIPQGFVASMLYEHMKYSNLHNFSSIFSWVSSFQSHFWLHEDFSTNLQKDYKKNKFKMLSHSVEQFTMKLWTFWMITKAGNAKLYIK